MVEPILKERNELEIETETKTIFSLRWLLLLMALGRLCDVVKQR
jgi:hypothetical protein